MRALWTVFQKEVLENLRDRRTVRSAMVLGPLGATLLFALMMKLSIARGREHKDRTLQLAVA